MWVTQLLQLFDIKGTVRQSYSLLKYRTKKRQKKKKSFYQKLTLWLYFSTCSQMKDQNDMFLPLNGMWKQKILD